MYYRQVDEASGTKTSIHKGGKKMEYEQRLKGATFRKVIWP